jgi:sorbitol-specific phosphotransferase system component IIBC
MDTLVGRKQIVTSGCVTKVYYINETYENKTVLSEVRSESESEAQSCHEITAAKLYDEFDEKIEKLRERVTMCLQNGGSKYSNVYEYRNRLLVEIPQDYDPKPIFDLLDKDKQISEDMGKEGIWLETVGYIVDEDDVD